jgi:hypothetical protein
MINGERQQYVLSTTGGESGFGTQNNSNEIYALFRAPASGNLNECRIAMSTSTGTNQARIDLYNVNQTTLMPTGAALDSTNNVGGAANQDRLYTFQNPVALTQGTWYALRPINTSSDISTQHAVMTFPQGLQPMAWMGVGVNPSGGIYTATAGIIWPAGFRIKIGSNWYGSLIFRGSEGGASENIYNDASFKRWGGAKIKLGTDLVIRSLSYSLNRNGTTPRAKIQVYRTSDMALVGESTNEIPNVNAGSFFTARWYFNDDPITLLADTEYFLGVAPTETTDSSNRLTHRGVTISKPTPWVHTGIALDLSTYTSTNGGSTPNSEVVNSGMLPAMSMFGYIPDSAGGGNVIIVEDD